MTDRPATSWDVDGAGPVAASPAREAAGRIGESRSATEELEGILGHLARLVDADHRLRVEDLGGRLQAGTVRVLLLGEAKRGKSTVGNALLGRAVLPSGVTPVTSVTTTVRSGSPERAEVAFVDGRVERVALEEVARFVTEQGNPRNGLGVRAVDVLLESGLPTDSMSIVDTPGTGSVYTHNTDEAVAARGRMDLAVLVLTADPPLSAAELALVDEVRHEAVAMFVVLNKVDRLAPEECDQALRFIHELLPGLTVLPCSARAGLQARLSGDSAAYESSGVHAVETAIVERVVTRGRRDLLVSIARSASALVAALQDEVDVTLAALADLDDALQARVLAFRAALVALNRQAQEAADRVEWRLRQQRRTLTEDAAERVRTLTHEARALVGDSAHTGSSEDPRLVADQVNERLACLVRDSVDDWRRAWTARLEDWLAGVAAEEQEHVDRATTTLRDAAQRELGLTLRLPPFALELPERSHFRFDFSDPVGWQAPFAETVRRHTPTPLARRRIVKDLHRRAADLPDRHLGRARHDLDERLRAATRSLGSALGAGYAGIADRLTAALDSADASRSSTEAELARETERLAERSRRLTALSAALDRLMQEP